MFRCNYDDDDDDENDYCVHTVHCTVFNIHASKSLPSSIERSEF